MTQVKSSSEDSDQNKSPEIVLKNSKRKKAKSSPNETSSSPADREVLIKVGGFEYKTPTKRTRVLLGSIVIGLNLILVLAVLVYFKNPAFQEFVYNVGRS